MASFQVLALLCLFARVPARLQEMTWKMDRNHLSYFPRYGLNYKFVMEHEGPHDEFHLDFVSYGSYSAAEHLGTHMDAPYHFHQQGKHIDEIPLEDLMGPLVRIDISERASQVEDAEVTIEDLLDWEDKHGPIPKRSFVLMYSGWDQFFGDNEKYLGSNVIGGSFHFPGFSTPAARWLLNNRDILGLGSDSISCDPMSHLFDVHQVILPAGKLCIENLKDVRKVPECGARFMMLPVMLKNGTGAQGRAFAEWYPGVGFQTSCKGNLKETPSYFTSGSVSFAALLMWIGMTVVLCMFICLLFLNYI